MKPPMLRPVSFGNSYYEPLIADDLPRVQDALAGRAQGLPKQLKGFDAANPDQRDEWAFIRRTWLLWGIIAACLPFAAPDIADFVFGTKEEYLAQLEEQERENQQQAELEKQREQQWAERANRLAQTQQRRIEFPVIGNEWQNNPEFWSEMAEGFRSWYLRQSEIPVLPNERFLERFEWLLDKEQEKI